jgi:nitrous oxide reductase accessory protein NosL
MKKINILLGILITSAFTACTEAPKTEKPTPKKVEMSEEDKALEKEMEELDEDVQALETVKK